MRISEVLSRAWNVIWNHKVLWIFGILAGCSNVSSGGSNFRWTYSSGEAPPNIERFFARFSNLTNTQVTLLVIALAIFFLLIVLLAIFLGTVGRIGLIRGAQEADAGAAQLTLGGLFQRSTPFFWRIFGLNLLFGLAILVVVLLLVALAAASGIATGGVTLLCFIPLICVFVPLMWLVALVLEQANLAIVLEDLGIRAGVRRGWQVFRENLGMMIVMALILYLGVGFVGGLIIALPLIVLVIPIVMGGMIGTDQSSQYGLLIAGLCFLAYLPVLLLLSGVLQSYIESAWTLTFLRLTHRPPAVVTEVPAVPA
jgi:hypothetical protein